jgi:hypothetical protein
MSFCATCGRQRNGTARFCGTCGTEFSDPPAATADQGPPPEDAAQPAPPEGVTRMDMIPEVTGVEPPAAEPGPIGSWYQPEAQGTGQDPDTSWQSTQTVQATPTQAAGYSPTAYTPPAPSAPTWPPSPPSPPAPTWPPGPQAAPPARGGARRGLLIVVAVVVVLAAGGGYALATTLGKHSAAQPPANPTAGVSTPTARTTLPTSSPAASASASTTPTPTPTPSPTLSLVAISPSVTSSAEPQAETLLSHYFHAINTHNYTEYLNTQNPVLKAHESQSNFDSGYSSSTDSRMTLTALSANGSGLTATVTFTSHQSPGQSVDNSACNAWTLNLYLVPQGTGYLIGPSPSGYLATYSDC